jgi:hypothetical protein
MVEQSPSGGDDMKWQTIVVGIIAVPILALFGGIGFLAYQVGQTWDARSTDALVAGVVATCGGGAVVIGVLLSLIVGIPFAIRMFGEAGYSQRGWREPSPTLPFPASTGHHRPPSAIDTTWRQLPVQPQTPPWGVTGGGNTQLLSAPQQDKRFGIVNDPTSEQ